MSIENKSGVISVDLGTSSVRACFIDLSLNIIHASQKSIRLETDIKGKAEQDAEEVIEAAFECIRNTGIWAKKSGFRPLALSFSNAVSSLICLDKDFKPLRPMMTYADVRAYQEAENLKLKHNPKLFNSTACPVHASYWLPKLIWLQNNDFPISKSNYFCTIKDLLIYKLTGQFVTDYSNAVATGMCNVVTGSWDQDLFYLVGLRNDQFAEISPTTTVVEPESKTELEKLHLPKDIKIILGATDGVLSSLGAGAFKPGQVTTMIGSSGACRMVSASPLVSGQKLRIWSYPLTNEIWIRGGAMNSGGLVSQWFIENIFQGKNTDKDFDRVFELAGSVDAGSEGVIFLPYLFGERAPIWNEKARGVYFGIHGNHKLSHFARATFEGILFALFSIFETLTSDRNGEIEIRATGGFVRSELMLQIQSDIFNASINVLKNFEGSSVGAAALALKAINVFHSLEFVTDLLPIEKTYFPNSAASMTYQHSYENFKKIYQRLEPIF